MYSNIRKILKINLIDNSVCNIARRASLTYSHSHFYSPQNYYLGILYVTYNSLSNEKFSHDDYYSPIIIISHARYLCTPPNSVGKIVCFYVLFLLLSTRPTHCTHGSMTCFIFPSKLQFNTTANHIQK